MRTTPKSRSGSDFESKTSGRSGVFRTMRAHLDLACRVPTSPTWNADAAISASLDWAPWQRGSTSPWKNFLKGCKHRSNPQGDTARHRPIRTVPCATETICHVQMRTSSNFAEQSDTLRKARTDAAVQLLSIQEATLSRTQLDSAKDAENPLHQATSLWGHCGEKHRSEAIERPTAAWQEEAPLHNEPSPTSQSAIRGRK